MTAPQRRIGTAVLPSAAGEACGPATSGFFNYRGCSRAERAQMGRNFLALVLNATIEDLARDTGKRKASATRVIARQAGVAPKLLGDIRRARPVAIGTGETVCDAIGLPHSHAGIEWWGSDSRSRRAPAPGVDDADACGSAGAGKAGRPVGLATPDGVDVGQTP